MGMSSLNKKLGKQAIVLCLLKNVHPVNLWKEHHPNDYRLRRDKFEVVELGTRADGKKVLKIKHKDWPQNFEILPTQAKLDKPGPPNQYFATARRPEPPAVEEGESDDEPVGDAAEPANQRAPPNHGWVWQNWQDENMVDDRGAVSRNDPFINAGNENLRLWSTGQFFDAFSHGDMLLRM